MSALMRHSIAEVIKSCALRGVCNCVKIRQDPTEPENPDVLSTNTASVPTAEVGTATKYCNNSQYN
jgi:hypothetical protein